MNAFLDGLNQAAAVGLAALLNTLWYAAVVAALTWAVLRFVRRVNAATRYWLWTAVLAFLVLLPFLPALMSQLKAAEAAPAAAAPLDAVDADRLDCSCGLAIGSAASRRRRRAEAEKAVRKGAGHHAADGIIARGAVADFRKDQLASGRGLPVSRRDYPNWTTGTA